MSKKKRLLPVTDVQWDEVHPFNKEITELFLDQSQLSLQTLKQYRSGARQFFRWVNENVENKPLHELKSRDALRYQKFLKDNGQSVAAAKFKRSIVSSLCNLVEVYYSDEYPRFRNIFSKAVPNPVGEPVHEKVAVTVEELKFLIDTLREQGELQMVAYILFSYHSGARRAEVGQMNKDILTHPYHVDKKGNTKNYYFTNVIRTKGGGEDGKRRPLTFNDEARDAIVEWLELRGEDDEKAIFVRKYKDGTVEPLQPTAFNDWCTNKFSVILEKRIYPHIWRVSRATHMIDEGKDIKAVQALLGHESSETSEIYVIRDNTVDLDSAYD